MNASTLGATKMLYSKSMENCDRECGVQVKMSDDPLGKVKGMIQDLIVRLMEEPLPRRNEVHLIRQ